MKYYILILLFTPILFSAQTANRQSYSVEKYGTIDITKHQEKWYSVMQHMEMPSPSGNSYKSYLLNQKLRQEEKYPRKNAGHNAKSASTVDIYSYEGFEGNEYNNSVPNDNSIAISDDGILVSAINRNYQIWDTNADTLMDEGWLNDFMPSTNTSSKYDPKLTYDPESDRFILVFLVGTNHVTSKIACCFSSSNNPLDPWHVYLIEGNALQTGHWTDYPAIAVNQDDFFITGNLLEDNVSWQLGFQQSIIWQIDKQSGYDGNATLSMEIWSGMNDNGIKLRNLHPVKGARGLTGPNQYFLSNKNFSLESDTVYLVEITDSYQSNDAQINVRLIHNPNHYFLSPSGRQSINKVLATNDSRMLGAVQDEQWIQYVHNSMDTATGNCAVYHGIIYDYKSNPYIEGRIISDPDLDLGYPNIASTGINTNELEAVIGMNYTSPNDTNGVGIFYMNNDEEYSDVIRVHRGDSPISILNDTIDRWGDYFGIQRRYNNPCEVWLAGMYGKVGENGCHISKVLVNETCRTPIPTDTLNPVYNEGGLFPNPVRDMVSVDFMADSTSVISAEIVNELGQYVAVVYKDEVKKGENRFSFSVHRLRTGIYFLKLIRDGEVLKVHKFIVE